MLCSGASVAQTAAGTVIRNIADQEYSIDGVTTRSASNEILLTIAERLDVRLAAERPPVRAADGAISVDFALMNSGNGAEAFVVDVAFGENGPKPDSLLYDGAALTDGRTGAIAPGASIRLTAIWVAGSAMASAGTITVDARATTGSGAAGTVHAGLGDGGGDAVVGATGARAMLSIPIDAGAAQAVFEKSQSVTAPDGSARPVRGAVVTYRLVARFGVAARAARIDDPVPAGTRYVPGSLRIDDATLSDADDGDAGGCDGARVTVALGDVPAAAARTIRFQVMIQ